MTTVWKVKGGMEPLRVWEATAWKPGHGWDWESQSIPGAKWCGQNITLQENVLSIPNGK